MVIPDQSRVVQLDGLVEELALVKLVRLEFHVHHICGHLPILGLALLFSLFSSRRVTGELGVEPGADGANVLVVGEDGERPVELGK